MIIQLTESVFGWICQWTTGRCCITIVRVESWRLQRHSQTNLSGVFCLSFKTICVLHAHSRRDASKLPSDYIANANSTPDVFYDLTDTLPWWKVTAQDLPCWATAVQKMVLFQPSSAAAKRVFSLLVTMFVSCYRYKKRNL